MRWPATLALLAALALPAPASEVRAVQPEVVPGLCFYDCNGDGRVTIGEIQRVIAIFLAAAPISRCPPLEARLQVNIADVQAAANEFLYGCIFGLSGPTMPG